MNALATALYAVWTLTKTTAPCDARPCAEFQAVDEEGNEQVVNVLDTYAVVESIDDMTEVGKLHAGMSTLRVEGSFDTSFDVPGSVGKLFRVEKILRGPLSMRPAPAPEGANVSRDASTTGGTRATTSAPASPTRADGAGFRRP